jgi:hypothetical protein
MIGRSHSALVPLMLVYTGGLWSAGDRGASLREVVDGHQVFLVPGFLGIAIAVIG